MELIKTYVPGPLKKILYPMILAGLILLITGTFVDLPLDRFLYHPGNEEARFMSAIASAPCFWCLNLSALLFISPGLRLSPKQTIGCILIAALEITGSLIYCISLIMEQFSMNIWLAIFIALPLCWAVPIYIFKQFLYLNNKARLQMGLYFLGAAILSLLCVYLLKFIFARPRYHYLESHPDAVYQPWFQIWGRVSSSTLGADGSSDWLRSFPSGHTAAASCITAFLIIPRVLPHPTIPTAAWVALSILWISLTALSRMVLGMHFLSDVAGGYLITLICILFCIAIFYKHIPRTPPLDA